MAVGTISSPTTWLLRRVIPPSWLQNMQDTLNNVYAYKSQTRYAWFGVGGGQVGTNWSLDLGASAGVAATCSTAAGAGIVSIPIPVFYNSGSEYQTITSIGVRVNKASTGTTNIKAYKLVNLSTGSGPTSTQLGSTASSTTSGHQIISVTGLTAAASDDQLIWVEISAANNGDIVYAAKVTFDNSTIV